MAYNKHNADKCDQTPPVCDICRKRHLTALHVEATPGSKDKLNITTTDTKSTTTAYTQVCGEEETSKSCARIFLIRAYHQSNPAKKITTYAVLDDQSTDTFIADALLEQLEVDATEVDLQVNTIVGSNSIRTKKVVGLSIQDLENEYGPIKVPFAYSREYIPASHEDIATPPYSQSMETSHIADKIQHRSDVDIGLLIGRNVTAAFQPINVIFGKDEEPWAEQYKFGWTIIGRVSKDEQRTQNSASVNRVTVERETLLDRSKETSRPPPFEKVINTKDVTSKYMK